MAVVYRSCASTLLHAYASVSKTLAEARQRAGSQPPSALSGAWVSVLGVLGEATDQQAAAANQLAAAAEALAGASRAATDARKALKHEAERHEAAIAEAVGALDRHKGRCGEEWERAAAVGQQEENAYSAPAAAPAAAGVPATPSKSASTGVAHTPSSVFRTLKV